MIQSIGIQFGAKGVESILEDFNKIDKRITATANMFSSLASQLGTLGKVGPGLKDLDMALGSVSGKTQTAAKAMGSLSANVHSAAQGAEKLKGVNSALMAGGDAGGGLFGGKHGAMPYMIQWQALSAVINGVKFAIHDIAAASSRLSIAGALGELDAISFDRVQKAQAENASREYVRRNPDMNAVDVTKSLSQTGSAFSVEQLGVHQLTKMNESAMTAAKLSKQTPEKMAEQISKMTLSVLGVQTEEVYNLLKSGGSADIKGYGRVNIAEMFSKNAAMLTKVVEKSSAWGPGLGDFWQYAGAPSQIKGWDPGASLSYAGTLMDAGFKGAKTGRSLKDTLFNSDDDWAKLDYYSDTGYKKDDKGKLIKPGEDDLASRRALVNKAMSTPETWADYLIKREKKITEAVEKSKTTGFSITKDAGFSRDFLPQMLAMSKGGALRRWTDQMGEVRGATEADMNKKRQGQLDDTGLTTERLSKAFDGLTQSIAKSENILTKSLNGLARAFNLVSEKIEAKNVVDAVKKDISATKSRWDEEFKEQLKTHRGPSDEQLRSQRGPQGLLDLGNTLLNRGYKEDMAGLPKLQADATPQEKEILKTQQKQIKEKWDARKNEIQGFVKGLTENMGAQDPGFYGPDGEFMGPSNNRQYLLDRESKKQRSLPPGQQLQQGPDGSYSSQPNITMNPKFDVHVTIDGQSVASKIKGYFQSGVENLQQFGMGFLGAGNIKP